MPSTWPSSLLTSCISALIRCCEFIVFFSSSSKSRSVFCILCSPFLARRSIGLSALCFSQAALFSSFYVQNFLYFTVYFTPFICNGQSFVVNSVTLLITCDKSLFTARSLNAHLYFRLVSVCCLFLILNLASSICRSLIIHLKLSFFLQCNTNLDKP